MIRAHKSLKAARALIGAQAGVYAHVVLQVIVVSKGSSTLRTQVRLFSCMLPHVNLELVLSVRENTSENEIKMHTQKMFMPTFKCAASDSFGRSPHVRCINAHVSSLQMISVGFFFLVSSIHSFWITSKTFIFNLRDDGPTGTINHFFLSV